MKAFRFRLEQALRWRTAQAQIEEAKTARAAARVSALQTERDARRAQFAASAKQISGGGSGSSLERWTAYSRRTGREIGEIEKHLREAERLLGEQLRVTVEANRRLRLLENLKQADRRQWSAEIDRELEAFAGEAFLVAWNRGRLQSEKQSGA